MDSYILEWLVLMTKWIHLIVGIAWIGASFYFNWLEGHLERGKSDLNPGVAGDLWAVHGGGFYHVEKFEVAPAKLPELLHWFKWEAYFTLITGVVLLTLVFYRAPSLYLIDSAVADISPFVALISAVGSIIVMWLVYDTLCKTKLVENGLAFFSLIFALIALYAFGAFHVLSAKAAFIHVGAVIGTIMVANVFFVIIPSQKTMVKAMQAGMPPDGDVGHRGFIRSLHNNYFTLPVLFIMIAAHYPIAFANKQAWVLLVLISLAGVLVRHFFNLKNRGRKNYLFLVIPFFLIVFAIWFTAPKSSVAQANTEQVGFDAVYRVMKKHCIVCHAKKPTFPGFNAPPNGVSLELKADIEKYRDAIYAQTVATHAMPLGNVTHMTDGERALIGAWIKQYKTGGKP